MALRAKILHLNNSMEGIKESDQYRITGKELIVLDIPELYTTDVYLEPMMLSIRKLSTGNMGAEKNNCWSLLQLMLIKTSNHTLDIVS